MDLSIPKDEDKHANCDKVATIFEGAVDWEPFIPKREAQKRGFGLAGEILCVHFVVGDLWSVIGFVKEFPGTLDVSPTWRGLQFGILVALRGGVLAAVITTGPDRAHMAARAVIGLGGPFRGAALRFPIQQSNEQGTTPQQRLFRRVS